MRSAFPMSHGSSSFLKTGKGVERGAAMIKRIASIRKGNPGLPAAGAL